MAFIFLTERRENIYVLALGGGCSFLFAQVPCFISSFGGQTLEKSSQGDLGYGSARAEVLMPGERGRERGKFGTNVATL